MLRHSLVLAWGILVALNGACLASPSVTAVLSNSDAAVGEMVQLEVRLTDAGSATVPNDIRVDGLEIHQTGTSRQFEMHNMTTRSSVTYTYTVLPLKPGTFKIPPQTIEVGGSREQTPELTLRVSGSPGGQNAPNTAGSPGTTNAGPLAFAELIVPKKTAYVGEMIPVVIRRCFAGNVRFDPRLLGERPAIAAQAFTVQPVQQPNEGQRETTDGKEWNVFTYKTAIAATRPGKFEVEVAPFATIVAVPRRYGVPRNRSPLDPFNLDDPFSDPFFRDPFGNFIQQQRITLVSEPVALEIKPLPPNAPASFTGAVGNFTMTTEAKPTKVQVGDPITVTSVVSGRGNFDRVNAPVLEDDTGWHKYPPSGKFKQDDEVGISGQKTFEMVLSPNDQRPGVPPLLFSYFDPAKERYETLQSVPVPIKVEGGASVAAASPPAATTPGPAAAPPKAATPPPRDILYQLSDRPARSQSFTPLYARNGFWLAQLIPLVALAGSAGWTVQRARLQNRDARRVALQHEVAQLTRKLRHSDASTDDYFPHASRLVQLKTALAKNIDPNVVDVDAAARVFALDEKERRQLEQIFEHSDELRYSGTGNGHEQISPQTRKEILHFIENLRA